MQHWHAFAECGREHQTASDSFALLRVRQPLGDCLCVKLVFLVVRPEADDSITFLYIRRINFVDRFAPVILAVPYGSTIKIDRLLNVAAHLANIKAGSIGTESNDSPFPASFVCRLLGGGALLGEHECATRENEYGCKQEPE